MGPGADGVSMHAGISAWFVRRNAAAHAARVPLPSAGPSTTRQSATARSVPHTQSGGPRTGVAANRGVDQGRALLMVLGSGLGAAVQQQLHDGRVAWRRGADGGGAPSAMSESCGMEEAFGGGGRARAGARGRAEAWERARAHKMRRRGPPPAGSRAHRCWRPSGGRSNSRRRGTRGLRRTPAGCARTRCGPGRGSTRWGLGG